MINFTNMYIITFVHYIVFFSVPCKHEMCKYKYIYINMTYPNAMNTIKTKNVKLHKFWAIIHHHYAVDSQGELKLTQGKKRH